MKNDFWLERWKSRNIGFHEGQVNQLLTEHWGNLNHDALARVFVPLCGKTHDIHWLLERGHRVAGAELSEAAIMELFEELGVTPRCQAMGSLKRYSASTIDIFVGDIFDLDAAMLGTIDVIYDRAALVALPKQTRRRYARHLQNICVNAPQLLITFDYDQSQMPGPPFSVPDEEIAALYGKSNHLECLEKRSVPGGLKGKCKTLECAWHLQPSCGRP